MSKKKSPVRRDEDFEELDLQLEEAMRALESVNERTATVLQRVEQGGDVLSGEADTGDGDGDTPGGTAAEASPDSSAEPELPAEA